MSDNQYDDLFEDENEIDEASAPKPLRDAYKALKAKARAEIEKRDVELNELRGTVTKSKLDSFVKGKNLPEDKATLFAELIKDKSPDEWEKFGALFEAANPQPEPEADVDEPTGPQGQSVLSPEQQAAMQATASVVPGTFNPGSDDDISSQLDALYKPGVSSADREAGLRRIGALQ